MIYSRLTNDARRTNSAHVRKKVEISARKRRIRPRSKYPPIGGCGWSMIPKSGHRFSEKIMLRG
jgi:hypothetical protein